MAKRKKSRKSAASGGKKKTPAPAPAKGKQRRWVWPVVLVVSLLLIWQGIRWFAATPGRDQGLLEFPRPPQRAYRSAIRFEDFVGSEACEPCHKQEYQLWRRSTHGNAGGDPDRVHILGKFDGRPRRFKDAVVIPQKTGRGQYQFVVRQKGFPEKTFRVDAVVGGGHMVGGGTQTYFSRFPDGTLRFLPFDFIRKEQVWFGETKDRRGWVPITPALSITDLSEWPPSRILGGEPSFKNCQECHGSQIQTFYDTRQKKYVSRYQTLQINCESCHGPGRRHIELMRQDSRSPGDDIGMEPLAALSKDASVNLCSRCHALKDQLEPGYLPGKGLQNYYSLKFPMLGGDPYHADGRIRAFGYQQNHLFSDCYLNGSMTCVDCHDPHSQDYRDIWGRPLVGKFDNGQCTDCHASKALAPEKHSHHKPDSPGNRCTSCHMPFLQHRAMGKTLRFARSDHTIPIPRPAFDNTLGIENACSQCHRDWPVERLQNQVEHWWGSLKPHKAIVTALHEADQLSDRITAARRLVLPEAGFPMAQFAAMAYFVEHFLEPDMPRLEGEVISRLRAFAESEDVDLKALALAALHLAGGEKPDVRRFLIRQLRAEGGQDRPLRLRWGLALGYLGSTYRDRGDTRKALLTFEKALEVLPDHEPTWTHLGYTYQAMGDHGRAVEAFRKAADLAPDDPLPWVNMGVSLAKLQSIEQARAAYHRAIQINPWKPEAYFNLGNLAYKEKDYESAIGFYRKAVELNPALARGHFYLARCYILTKQFRKAYDAALAGLQYEQDNALGQQMFSDLERYIRQQPNK
ncbi:MAG: tetratricopeptide repeat protein [candidate division KSB1 bacterium]|nr:tetratricopeptide repeat protein [candidate division KSB1 bacterium]